MNIYQLIVVNPEFDRKETACLFTVPHRLFATIMGAVDYVMADANKERSDLWDYLNGPDTARLRPVGLIEWDIDVPDAPDAPDSPAPKAWVTYSWTDSVTGIAYFIYECEVGK